MTPKHHNVNAGKLTGNPNPNLLSWEDIIQKKKKKKKQPEPS